MVKMITKTDVFSFAKTLARNFVLPAIIKSVVYAVFGGMIFFIAGLLVYNFGPALLLQGTYIVLRIVVAIFVLIIYTALGALIGLSLGASSAIRNKLPAAEQGIHQMLSPVMSAVIEKIPVGQIGIPIEQFNHIVDGRITDSIKTPEQRSGLFSVINFAARFVMQKLLAITRAVLVVNFVQELQANGESRVTAQALERFARERLMRLVIGYTQLKLSAVRKISWIVSIVLLFVPAVLVVINVIHG